MKASVKIVVILFSGIMALFTLHQLFVGNPFKDEIHPFFALVPFLLMGILSTLLVFKSKEE